VKTLRRDEDVGDWDLYVLLADTYQWTPQQVDGLDPDFLTELLAKITARADHADMQRKRDEAKQKRRR
jgi:hypothetical protein